jgi:hypothetical protein
LSLLGRKPLPAGSQCLRFPTGVFGVSGLLPEYARKKLSEILWYITKFIMKKVYKVWSHPDLNIRVIGTQVISMFELNHSLIELDILYTII